jgi:hypothetical protein
MSPPSRLTRIWWRLLDVVKPKRDYAGKYPRGRELSPEEVDRVLEIMGRRLDGRL